MARQVQEVARVCSNILENAERSDESQTLHGSTPYDRRPFEKRVWRTIEEVEVSKARVHQAAEQMHEESSRRS